MRDHHPGTDNHTGLARVVSAGLRDEDARGVSRRDAVFGGGSAAVLSQVFGPSVVGRQREATRKNGREASRSYGLSAVASAPGSKRDELDELVEDQAALRRVATLVARAARPAEVFEAVCGEVARLVEAPSTKLFQYG